MIEQKASHPDDNTDPLSKSSKILDPYHNQKQRIVLFGINAKETNALLPASLDSNLFKSEDKRNYPLHKPSKIVIDLQKEFDEDQELLDLLQPRNNNNNNNINNNQNELKKTGIKALFELKQAKIDMIPEEDEDKLKQDQRILNLKEKESNNNNKKMMMMVSNGNNIKLPTKCYPRKKQIDFLSSQDINQNNSNCNNNINNNTNYQQPQQLSNGCLITNDKNNESPSTSGITHDSIKKQINTNSNSNNINCQNTKPIEYGFLTQKLNSMKTQHLLPSNNLPQKKYVRPLSNPHLSNLNLKKEDNLLCNQNIQGIINDLMNKREFSHNDRKRSQLGSASSLAPPNNLYEKQIKKNYKNKEYFSNSNLNINNLRQLHKIKIERGLASTKLIEKFSKQLSYDYTNDFNKNRLNSHKRDSNSYNNEPIKIIKM